MAFNSGTPRPGHEQQCDEAAGQRLAVVALGIALMFWFVVSTLRAVF